MIEDLTKSMDFTAIAGWGLPLLVVLAAVVFGYWVLQRTLGQQPGQRLYRQLGQVLLTVLALIALTVVLPFATETRGQLLSLLGLVITAVIALSSTTFVSNAMAGITLKIIGSFHTGDFIRVADHFGRVRTKTLLHTEIQNEDRDTITLPNMFVITNPVTVVDQSGTLISADVGIGYDVHRRRIRECLLQAASSAGLTEAFTQVLQLGDYAVTYRVSGFLADPKNLVSKRSELRAQILDAMHQDGIEIMSPSIMNQRPIPPDHAFVPRDQQAETKPDMVTGKAERLMFDKADEAARLQKIRHQVQELEQQLKKLEAEDNEANALDIAWRRHQLNAQRAFLAQVDDPDSD
ncbi:MAG: mechanosensitive ion channel family protein [Pseudomonadota bacterium]